jgi:hypothetical protein
MAVSLVKDLRKDPIVLRGNYATLAVEQAVVDGIRRHGDDFVLVVEKTSVPPADGAAQAQPSPAGPESDGPQSVGRGSSFLPPNGNVAVPPQTQPKAEVIGGQTGSRA